MPFKAKAEASMAADDDGTPGLTLEQSKALAQHIFSKKNRERSKQESYETILNKRKIEKKWQKRKGISRKKARYFNRAGFKIANALKPVRCWDWVIHGGDVHYAINASSFTSYTRIDAWVRNATGNGAPIKALGIGVVKINAMRALDSDNVCEITLHNVLHLPSMPCNGISQIRLEGVGCDVWTGPEGLQVMEPTGAWMFCGTKERDLHRVAIYDRQPRFSTLPPFLQLHNLNICASDPDRIEELGYYTRKIQSIQAKPGYKIDTGPHTEVEC